MATKKKTTKDFTTKEFHVYFPFETKDVACPECGTMPCTCEEPAGKVIQIAGFANFCGDISNESNVFVDHCGDVMVPEGFDLSVWNKNPQILWQHNREYTIGKGLQAIKKKDGLEVIADVHEHAMEERDFYKIAQGLVTMFSVGFKTLAGEWKTINDREVFFITKSLLYEVSVVSIPMNSESQFTRIKSMEDGTFSTVDFHPQPQVKTGAAAHNKQSGDNVMQIKLRDKLSEVQIKELEDLGLGDSLDELKDIDSKTYIDSALEKLEAKIDAAVEKAVTAAIEAFKIESAKSLETPEVKTETTEDATDETKTDVVTEIKTDAPSEDEEANAEVSKSLTDTSLEIAKLIALANAE